MSASSPETASRTAAFRALHENPGCFIMPNAWNGVSAAILTDYGFGAVGTTSAGLAYDKAIRDGVGDVTLELALSNVREIVGATRLPVNVDFEDAYADSVDQVAENIRACAETGASGCTFEDWNRGSALYETEEAVDRVRAAVQAADALGTGFVVTARSECFLRGHPDPLPEVIKRLQLFQEAGAHCLYAPGIRDRGDIKTLLSEVDRPVNILVGMGGMGATLEEMEGLGVRRLSVGGALMRATLQPILDCAEMMAEGRFDFAGSGPPDPKLREYFSKAVS